MWKSWLDRLDGTVTSKKSRYSPSVSMVGSGGWFKVVTVDLYVWKSWLDRLDGTVPSKKSRYTRSVSMVGSVGWFRVGTVD